MSRKHSEAEAAQRRQNEEHGKLEQQQSPTPCPACGFAPVEDVLEDTPEGAL
eukprot:CAMPEP_0180440466 /NCGR_PEP_ID=MMETSP1036_2-20121128/13122_1 /TAXON_ID=632150 /ORGANISM="Azadinium spinosum, Strain 3D9" /LENGTH=51 /DNA_ID=CAMNT_0022446645 /DNA_START=266 /DNA_END=421 /DNA_ORIENTATION=-